MLWATTTLRFPQHLAGQPAKSSCACSRRAACTTEAESVYREAAAAGNPKALCGLGDWLGRQPGRENEAEVEATYRQAAEAGDPEALHLLVDWLSERPGGEVEIEAMYRQPAEAGDTGALYLLAGWLSQQPGRQAEAEAVYRQAAAVGDPEALHSRPVAVMRRCSVVGSHARVVTGVPRLELRGPGVGAVAGDVAGEYDQVDVGLGPGVVAGVRADQKQAKNVVLVNTPARHAVNDVVDFRVRVRA